MKRIKFCFFIIFLLLAGCGGQEEVASTTAVPTPIPFLPTATPTQTVIPTAGATATAVPTPSQTPRPTTTAIPSTTPIPSPTPTSTPPDQFSPVPLDSTATYHLATPEPGKFIQVLQNVLLYGQIYSSFGQHDYGNQVRTNDGVAIQSFITHDFYSFYPDGIPDSEQFLSHPLFTSGKVPAWRSFIFGEIAQTGLVAYLNSHKVELHPNQTETISEYVLKPKQVDLNGDLQSDWLVQVSVYATGLYLWLPLLEKEGHQFELIPNGLPGTYIFGAAEADVTHDLTGDGLPEILLIQYGYMHAGWEGGFIGVYTWDGGQLVRLETINVDIHRSQGQVNYGIDDFDGDGRSEIHINWNRTDGFGCNWAYTDIYQWNGLQTNHVIRDDAPPDTPQCDVAKAIMDWRNTSEQEQMRLLEKVLRQWTPTTAPSPDYFVFVQLRLANHYASLGLDTDAWQLLDSITLLVNESRLASIVQQNRAETLPQLCANLNTLTGDLNNPLGLNTDINYYISLAASGAYPGSGAPAPGILCNPETLLISRVQNNFLSAAQTPPEALAGIGFTAAYSQTLNLDDDEENEWISLVSEGNILLVLDAQNGRWRSHLLAPNLSPLANMQINVRDLTADGQADLLILAHFHTPCLGESALESWGMLFDLTADNRYETVRIEQICDNTPPDITEMNTNFFFNETEPPAPFWDSMADEFPWQAELWPFAENGFFSYLDTLNEQVLTAEQPFTLPTELTTLINALPATNPDAQPVIQHLTYLLGYYYELRGEAATAVTTYLTLIHQYPTSPWAWLAWARLEPANQP